MDLASLANMASETARTAIKLSNDLHLELVCMRIRERWPKAASWKREWVAYDDTPGGDWYLINVKDEDDNVLHLVGSDDMDEPWQEEIDNILADIDDPPEFGPNEERTITFDGPTGWARRHDMDRAVELVGELHSAIYSPDDMRASEPMLAELEQIVRRHRHP